MTSISIRKDIVPLNAIFIQPNAVKPIGYTDETSLYGEYIKGTPNAAANPGNPTGSANHQHSAGQGDHTHTGNTAASHSHTVNFNPSTSNISPYTGGSNGGANLNHTHNATSANSTDDGVVTATTDGTHQHNSDPNQMAHKTEFFVKHSETTIGLRRRVLSQNTLFMWGQNASTTLPARYSKSSTLDDKHVKGVATANSTPEESLGNHNHTHNAHANHTHTMTMNAHTHGSAASSQVGGARENLTYNPTIPQNGYHWHNTGTVPASTAVNATSETKAFATHPSQTMEVAWKSIHYVQHTVVGLREYGLPIGSIAFWLDNVTTIPTGWQVCDGTNGTSNYLDKYPRGENSNTNAGATGGSNTHTHATGGGTHLHGSQNFSHAHTISNLANASWQYNNSGAKSGNTYGSILYSSHSHPMSVANSNSAGSLQNTTDTHTHDSQNHEPVGVLVSFIERLA
jgi:hypothetical protein